MKKGVFDWKNIMKKINVKKADEPAQGKGLVCDYVVCLPGNAPSSWKQAMGVMQMINELSVMGKRIIPVNAQSCNIYVVRNGVLRPTLPMGNRVNQKPWEGLIADYDRMIWIDSDNIIKTQDVLQLLSHDVDIAAAWYRQYGGGVIDDTNKAACGFWKRGTGYNEVRPLTISDIPKEPTNEKGLIEVDYAGMGLMIVKKGVFEKMPYPWFRSGIIEWEENGIQCADIDTDDSRFCFAAKELGYKIHVDPKVRILHQKMVDL